MSMIRTLHRFRDNPENPKNVQIPFYVLVGMDMVLSGIDTAFLADDEKAAIELLHGEILEKKAKVANRQAYTHVVRAKADEKQAALNAYHEGKKFNAVFYKK